MRVSFARKSEVVVVESVIQVQLETTRGQVQIRSGHAEYYGEVVPGVLIVTLQTGEQQSFPVVSGVCTVYNDQVTVLQ